MFTYPVLDAPETSRDYQEEFGGYNHNLRISDYEFYDEKNMTGDYYPVLSPRNKRGYISSHKYIDSIICKGKFCILCDDDSYSQYKDRTLKLYINNELISAFSKKYLIPFVPYTSRTQDVWYEYKMISVGAFLVIFQKIKNGPYTEGWYINTEDLTDYGELNAETSIISTGIPSATESKVTFIPCTREGDDFTYVDSPNRDINYVIVSSTPPDTTNLRNGQRWLDISGEVHYLKVWSSYQSMWTTINTTFIKIKCPNGRYSFVHFKKGDAVDISIDNLYLETDESVEEPLYEQCRQQIQDICTNIIIEDVADYGSYIIVSGLLDRVSYLATGSSEALPSSNPSLHVKRLIPYMDYICEYNNRIWGCRYGENRSGDYVNEIYACKQGDFKNWTVYQGISTDSYAATVGSDNEFTGCIAFQNSVLFFKENSIYKLYGSVPANYQIQEIRARGVQKGSEKSLCLVNETLFYKSSTDVCYYDGSLPVSISEPLGSERYSNAVFGSIKTKLYANMKDASGNWHLFTYDLSKGLWHKEDDIQLAAMDTLSSDLYFADVDGNIGTFTGTGTLESDFIWYAETGAIGYSLPDNKYISRIILRMSKEKHSFIRILIRYDEEDEWLNIAETHTEHGIKSLSIPIVPRRCDHFRLRIEGKGDCKILSLCKTIEVGSDEYVY